MSHRRERGGRAGGGGSGPQGNQKVQLRPIISLDPKSLKYFNARFLIAVLQSGFGNAEK